MRRRQPLATHAMPLNATINPSTKSAQKNTSFRTLVSSLISTETPALESEAHPPESEAHEEPPARVQIPWDPPQILRDRFL